MEKKEQKKRIAANTLYTMGGLIFMNGVLQLIITPLLNRYMGAKQLTWEMRRGLSMGYACSRSQLRSGLAP